MSLIRQIWLLLLATLGVALVASVTVNTAASRDTLQTQLRLKNSDNATALAFVLSQQKGQRELMELAAAAQFDTGFYRRIRITGADGKPLFVREANAPAQEAPAWFVALVPITSVPGVAQVSDGWRALGAVEVESQSSYAHDQLWRGSVRSMWAMAWVGLLAGLLAWLAVRRIRRPLDATVAQAASLQRGEYVTVAEPNVPELRRLARAMNAMVARLRTVFEGQAAQVESLRRQASCDTLTGLPSRSHFMARLAATLQSEDGTRAGGLVLLRVLQLGEINRSLGRDTTDSLIATIAHTLQAYTDRVHGAFAGRLNGADFALVLPEGGMAHESALALVAVLRAALPTFAGRVAVAAGAVEMRHGAPVAEVLGNADLALAGAESAGPFSVVAGSAEASAWAGLGEHEWHERVSDTLQQRRVRLGSFPVVNRLGHLIHLECPLRMQLEPGGAFEVAAQWLPLAVRSRLTPAADEHALALALEAIALDGLPRCVNLSPASLSDSGFATRLRNLLEAAPRAARSVWLEVGEAAAADRFELTRELARQVRATGARFGLEHAGERLSRIDRLFEAGLDYVKLDASITLGMALDANRVRFVEGLVTMLHSLSIQVIAEGVADERDAQALLACGADGLTGPWVRTAGEPTAPR
jgi:EAL domain-containing protein (putative c-di-GMP-specific phosphodiesterase class I)/GGDEF domain-containing protein